MNWKKLIDNILMKPDPVEKAKPYKDGKGGEANILNPAKIGQKRFLVQKGVKVYVYDIPNRHLCSIDAMNRQERIGFFKDLKRTKMENQFLLIRAINTKNAERKVERFHKLNPTV